MGSAETSPSGARSVKSLKEQKKICKSVPHLQMWGEEVQSSIDIFAADAMRSWPSLVEWAERAREVLMDVSCQNCGVPFALVDKCRNCDSREKLLAELEP